MVTTNASGTLLWLSGDRDFLIMGVVHGYMQVSLNLGGGRITLRSSTIVSDGAWHSILFIVTLSTATLYIDGSVAQQRALPPKYVVLDGYVGPLVGSPMPLWPDPYSYYTGWLHELLFNGIDLLKEANTLGSIYTYR